MSTKNGWRHADTFLLLSVVLDEEKAEMIKKHKFLYQAPFDCSAAAVRLMMSQALASKSETFGNATNLVLVEKSEVVLKSGWWEMETGSLTDWFSWVTARLPAVTAECCYHVLSVTFIWWERRNTKFTVFSLTKQLQIDYLLPVYRHTRWMWSVAWYGFSGVSVWMELSLI